MSTAGVNTCRVWLKHGIDFNSLQKPDGRNLVFIGSKFGHLEGIRFLEKEVGMDLCSFKNDGESTLLYALRRANFELLWYFMQYYIKNNKFSQYPTEVDAFLTRMRLLSNLGLIHSTGRF